MNFTTADRLLVQYRHGIIKQLEILASNDLHDSMSRAPSKSKENNHKSDYSKAKEALRAVDKELFLLRNI